MINTRLWVFGIAAGTVLLGTAAAAQQSAENAIEGRVAGFRDIGSAFKNIGDELKAGQPDRKEMLKAAQALKGYGAHMAGWFPPGGQPTPQPEKSWLERIRGWFSFGDSSAVVGEIESHAKPAIWTQRPQFDRHIRAYQIAAAGLAKATQRGNPAEISLTHRKLGATCKSCHDQFREEVD